MVIGVDGQVTTIVPDVLRPFWVHIKDSRWASWPHRIDTDYCRIEVLEAGEHWKVGFEDQDEVYGEHRPDYDYDEPLLDVLRMDGFLLVTVSDYGGYLAADVYYGDTLLFDRVCGGLFPHWIGYSKTVEISTTDPFTPDPEPGGILGWFATHKFATGLLVIGGITAVGFAIKKYWKK